MHLIYPAKDAWHMWLESKNIVTGRFRPLERENIWRKIKTNREKGEYRVKYATLTTRDGASGYLLQHFTRVSSLCCRTHVSHCSRHHEWRNSVSRVSFTLPLFRNGASASTVPLFDIPLYRSNGTSLDRPYFCLHPVSF